MATVSDILASKGSEIHTIAAAATVLEATRRMNEHQIGSLLILDGGRIRGILTERDVLRRVVAADLSPSEVRVAEVMTKEVTCCLPNTPVEAAGIIMRDHRARHLPVCDQDGQPLGLISGGDLNAYHVSDQDSIIQYLHEYIYGIY